MELYDSLQDRLKTQHEGIPMLIEDLTKEQIHYPFAPGKWTIHQNIAHLAKYQLIFIERLKLILDTKEPVFERYNAEADPDFLQWCEWPTEELLNRLEKDRQFLFTFITQLNSGQLFKVGVHPKFGKLSVVQWTEFFLLHESHHMFTIFQLSHH